MSTLPTQRNWTTTGEAHNGTDANKAKLARYFDALEWVPFVDGMSLPMMPGAGIQSAIKELRIPKVSHIAISNDMAPYGLYAVRGHYKNGMAQVYICDEGTRLVPLCSDFWQTEQANSAGEAA